MSKSGEIWEEKLSSDYAVKSAKIYRKILNEFLEDQGLDHEGLFELHRASLMSADPRDRDTVARMVKGYRKDLVERGVSTAHADQSKKAVRAFLDSNGLDFKIRGDRFKIRVEGQNRATGEHIEAFLEATGEYRTKALIHVLKDTGLRVSDVVQLNVGDVRNGHDFLAVNVRQKKTGNMARPIMGPQSVAAVKKWLQYRVSKDYPYSDQDPLFTDLEGPGAFTKRMSSDAVTQVFVRLMRKTGLVKITAHSLRKYHTTRCQAGGIPDAWVFILQGRTIPGSFGAYSKPTGEEMMAAYEKAYAFIAVGVKSIPIQELEAELELLTSSQNKKISDLEGLLLQQGKVLEAIQRAQKLGLIKKEETT